MRKEKDRQLLFDFVQGEKSVGFEKVKGICRCGYQAEAQKASIVIEMTVICPECKSVITLGSIR